MQRTYYYTITGLPDLTFTDRELPMTRGEFAEEMAERLQPADFDLLALVFYRIDGKNLIRALRGQYDQIDEDGMLDTEELRYGLYVPETLPGWMSAFIEKVQDNHNKLNDRELEFAMLEAFADQIEQIPNTFLRDWFAFDLNLSNVLTGLNARRYSRDLSREIIGDNFIAENVTASREHDFALGTVLPYVIDAVGLFEHEDLLVREIEIGQLRWAWLEHLLDPYFFTIEQVLGFAIKLEMLRRVSVLQAPDDGSRLDLILQSIKAGFDLPPQFAT